MDFMNLNQAAHGDREFGYIGARLGVARKVVAGHVSNPVVVERVATWVRAARGAHELRTMRVARFGDNMREVAVTEGDKVEAQLRFGVSVNTYGVTELVERVDAAGGSAIDDLVTEYLDAYDVAAELRPGGDREASLRYGAAIEIGLREFLTDGGFTAFTTNFEDLAGLRQLPGSVQRLMADGYGFGGEGDWKTSVILRTTKAHGRRAPGGTSFMEDYTYDLATPGSEKILGAHMLEVCPTIAGTRPTLEIHPLGIGGREDPVRCASPQPRGLRSWSASTTWATASGSPSTKSLSSNLTRPCPTSRSPAPSGSRSRSSPPPARILAAGGPHHTVLSTAVGTPEFRDLATMLSTELVVIDASTTIPSVENELRGARPTTAWQPDSSVAPRGSGGAGRSRWLASPAPSRGCPP